LLLDSEKAVRPDKRWAMVQDCIALLQSCVDSGMLETYCVVNVIWAKFDYFEAAADKQDHNGFRKQVHSEFQTLFGSRLPHFEFSQIAARPIKAPHLGIGHGVPALLHKWINFCPRLRTMELLPHGNAGSRESELFAIRHFASLKQTS
jgi:hypothetical protein